MTFHDPWQSLVSLSTSGQPGVVWGGNGGGLEVGLIGGGFGLGGHGGLVVNGGLGLDVVGGGGHDVGLPVDHGTVGLAGGGLIDPPPPPPG